MEDVCYRILSKQKPRTISSRKNNNCVWAYSLYNSLPKYLRNIEGVKTEKFKFELDEFLELIPDEPKMQNCVTAARSISILDQLSHRRIQAIYNSVGVSDSVAEQDTLLRNHSKYSKYEYHNYLCTSGTLAPERVCFIYFQM